VQQSSGREKENLPPEANISPSAGRARSDTTDNEDSDVVAMWERSVRDIFAALADEEGTHTFGFIVTTAKNPRDGELPAIALPPAPGVAPARSAVPGKFVAAGGIHPVEPAFRLSAVNGQQVSGRTAQEIKDMVSAGRLLLRLELICSQRKECQRRTVWCRRVQTLDKVRCRLDVFLNSRAAMHALSEGKGVHGRGVQGLELLRDGLERLLQMLDSTFNTAEKTPGSDAVIEDEKKKFVALLASISSSAQDLNSVTLAQHILTTAVRVLTPSSSASSILPATLSHLPQLSTPSRTALSEKGGRISGVGMAAGGGSGAGTPASISKESRKEVDQLQQEVSRLQQKLNDALAEVQKVGATAAASSARAEVMARAEADAVTARGTAEAVRVKEVKKITIELELERKDCVHFKKLCEQLRQNNAQLDKDTKQEEEARKAAVNAHREAQLSVAVLRAQVLEHEGSLCKFSGLEEQYKAASQGEQASKVMSEALKVQLAAAQEREQTAVAQVYNVQQQQHAQQQEHQKQQREIGALRERLEWAISDKDRAVTVCTAAVEGEKLYSAEVGVLKKRMAQLEKDEQALCAAAANTAIATARAAAAQSSENMMASISREDALGARYNILMKHSQETEQELEGAVGMYNILLKSMRTQTEASRTELDSLKKQLAESSDDAEVMTLAHRRLEEDLEQREQELDAVEEKHNLLLVQLREKGGRESAKLLKEFRSQSPPSQKTPREYQQPASTAESTNSVAQTLPENGANGQVQADAGGGGGWWCRRVCG